MASILRVDTITDASSNNSVATSVVFNGVLKQWCNLKGTSSTEILDSYNTTSVTDDATGKTTVTIASDMGNDDYAITTSAQENTCVHAHTSVTTGSYQAQSRGSDDQAFTDVTNFGCHVAGDLA